MGDILTPTTKGLLRRLADGIVKASNVPNPIKPRHEIVYGVVVSVQTGPPPTLTLKMSGAGSATNAGVRFGSNYYPTAGDFVKAEWYGGDLVVVGTLAANASGPRLFSIDWAWSGTTVVASGATGYIPKKRVPIVAGQKVTILGVQYYGRTAGDVFELYYNGVALGSGHTWTTTTGWQVDTSSVFPFAATNGDDVAPVIQTAVGDGWGVGVIYTTS